MENGGCIGPKSKAFYEYRAKGGGFSCENKATVSCACVKRVNSTSRASLFQKALTCVDLPHRPLCGHLCPWASHDLAKSLHKSLFRPLDPRQREVMYPPNGYPLSEGTAPEEGCGEAFFAKPTEAHGLGDPVVLEGQSSCLFIASSFFSPQRVDML